ncbi:type II secretion system protein N [Thermodesulfobacteriota bacterium]
MKLSLRGTVNAGMENAAAIIENSEEQKQKLYKIGNIIAGGVLSQILKEKVVIRIDRRDYVLIMDSISRPEEDESIVIIRRQDLENSLENIENFMSQVRIKPQFFNDGTGGLIVKDIRQGALLDQLGFRNGDVIQEINGVVIQNPYRLAVIYEGLKAVPFNILSFDTIGSNAKDILLGIDSQAGGIVNQTSKVLHKIESGEKIPVRFTRRGNKKAITLKFIE